MEANLEWELYDYITTHRTLVEFMTNHRRSSTHFKLAENDEVDDDDENDDDYDEDELRTMS